MEHVQDSRTLSILVPRRTPRIHHEFPDVRSHKLFSHRLQQSITLTNLKHADFENVSIPSPNSQMHILIDDQEQRARVTTVRKLSTRICTHGFPSLLLRYRMPYEVTEATLLAAEEKIEEFST